MAEYRIVVVGAGGAGKYSLCSRFIQGNYIEVYDPTLEQSFRKLVEIDGKACLLDIMKTPGQEEYSVLRDQYVKTGQGFVLVYSITSISSFDEAAKIYYQIMRILDGEIRPVFCVGLKADCEEERTVSTDFARSWAIKHNCGFIEASAKLNHNVNEIFYEIVRLIDDDRSFYLIKPGILDLRNRNIDNEAARQIQFLRYQSRGCQWINLTENPRLNQIPSSLGHLDPAITTRIDLDIHNLITSQRPFAKNARTIIEYAKGLLNGSLIKLNQVRLMVVGKAAAGKTSLVKRLSGYAYDPKLMSTDGIDLGELTFQGIRFVTWDFGGQKVYRFTHQLFLADNALYLILFKLTDSVSDSLRELRFWLNSILARSKHSRILLVGTHLDKVNAGLFGSHRAEKTSSQILQALSADYPELVPPKTQIIFSVSSKSGKSVKTLLNAIFYAAQDVNIEAPENYGEAQHFVAGLDASPPVVAFNSVIAGLKSTMKNTTDDQLSDILAVLDKLGLISVFANPNASSGGAIVLRPQWIANLLSTIVTTKHRFIEGLKGTLKQTDLTQHIWKDAGLYPPDHHVDLLRILTELHMLYEFHTGGDRLYFIPCMLQEEPPDLRYFIPHRIAHSSLFELHRWFVLPTAVPVAVIPPMLIMLLQRGELRARWQQGCVARLFLDENPETEAWLLLSRAGFKHIKLSVWGSTIQLVAHWIRDISTALSTSLTEFYYIPHEIIIPCPLCTTADATQALSSIPPHFSSAFSMKDIHARIVELAEDVICPRITNHKFRIDALAPDLLFNDLSFDIIRFAKGHLRFHDQCTSGRVVQATVSSYSPSQPSGDAHSTTLAEGSSHSSLESDLPTHTVKILESTRNNLERTSIDAFQEFKHEVYLMRSLNHPNVLKLEGICFQPLAIVMELASGGDLYEQLRDSRLRHICLPCRLKLTTDIARGMVHLHELNPPMVHRDLKSPNVFLTRSLIDLPSDDEDWAQPLAKVGDFGLSVLLTLGGELNLRRMDRNKHDPRLHIDPRWASPEILKGEKYTTKVDVFALGIIMREIEFVCSNGADRNKRYQKLMRICSSQSPSERPTMRCVYETLVEIAHLTCPALYQHLRPLPKTYANSLTIAMAKDRQGIAPAVIPYHLVPLRTLPYSSSVVKICKVCSLVIGKKLIICPICRRSTCTKCLNSCCHARTELRPSSSNVVHSDSIADRVLKCFLVLGDEILWFGFESGHVGAAVRTPFSLDQDLMVQYCSHHDAHPSSVTSLTYCSGMEDSTIWTSSEDSTISVWMSKVQSSDDVFEFNSLKGTLHYRQPKTNKFSKKWAIAWFEFERGICQWYRHRNDVKPLDSILIDGSIRAITLSQDESELIVEYDKTKKLILSIPDSTITQWYDAFKSVHGILRIQAGIVKLSQAQLPGVAISALLAVDYGVWSASNDFVLREWSLTDITGQDRVKELRLLRKIPLIQLPGSEPEEKRYKMIRISEHIIWIAVDRHWIVVDILACSAIWIERREAKLLDSLALIQNRSVFEVWTCHSDGQLLIWDITSEKPSSTSLRVDVPPDDENQGRPCCLAQVNDDQVWIGTSRGHVLAYDICSRLRVKSEAQPLPRGHVHLHQREIFALSSCVSRFPVVWSASRDQSLRRFSYDEAADEKLPPEDNASSSTQTGTDLHIAAEKGHVRAMKRLLKRMTISIDATRADGWTPLHIAAFSGHLKMTRLLLSNGANKEAINMDDATPLYLACREGHDSVVALLIDNGAKTDAARHDRTTPLFVASKSGHHRVVKRLLTAGVDPNIANQTGATALYVAAENGHLLVIEALLGANACITAAKYDGWTPLHVAVYKRYHSIVETLSKFIMLRHFSHIAEIFHTSNCILLRTHIYDYLVYLFQRSSPFQRQFLLTSPLFEVFSNSLSDEKLVRESHLARQGLLPLLDYLDPSINWDAAQLIKKTNVTVAKRSLEDTIVDVALKMYITSSKNRDDVRESGVCSILRTFDHPHIVKFFGNILHQDRHYLMMEYYPETLLGMIVDGKKGKESKLSDISFKMQTMCHVLSAICFLHSLPIVHRDVKPDNIFFRSDGHAVLGDFGISRAPGKTHVATRTASHAPPKDKHTSSFGPLDLSFDIWSFACVAWEILTMENLQDGKFSHFSEDRTCYPKTGEYRPPFGRPGTTMSFSRLGARSILLGGKCSDGLWAAIQSCWRRSNERPTAAQLFREIFPSETPLLDLSSTSRLSLSHKSAAIAPSSNHPMSSCSSSPGPPPDELRKPVFFDLLSMPFDLRSTAQPSSALKEADLIWQSHDNVSHRLVVACSQEEDILRIRTNNSLVVSKDQASFAILHFHLILIRFQFEFRISPSPKRLRFEMEVGDQQWMATTFIVSAGSVRVLHETRKSKSKTGFNVYIVHSSLTSGSLFAGTH